MGIVRDLGVRRHQDPSLLGVLDRVAGQIDQDLPEFSGIRDDKAWYSWSNIEMEFQVLDLSALSQHLHRVVDQRVQIEGSPLHGDLAGFDFGHVQHIVDETQKMISAAADDGEVFAVVLRQIRIAKHDSRKSEDRVQRSAQFMAHSRQENALGARGSDCLVARFDQFLCSLLNQVLQLVFVVAQLSLCAS